MADFPIRNNIRKLRFYHDEMTQKELAERVGVTRQTIVAIENAKYSPSLEVAFRIALVFDAPLHEVFIYDADADPHWTNKKQNKRSNRSE